MSLLGTIYHLFGVIFVIYLVNVTQVYISFLMFVCNCVNPACLEQNADLLQVKAFSKTPTSFKMLTQKVVLDSFLKF